MKYLRGSVNKEAKRVFNARPTLQNQVDALRAKVNSQKPETLYLRVTGYHNNTGTSTEQINYAVTNTLVSSTSFRDNVTGDRWKNLFLKLNAHFRAPCIGARILVYVPKKQGDRFTPTTHPFVQLPDPSSFWILQDKMVPMENGVPEHYSRTLSLRGLNTIYDSGAAAITKGEIIVSIISQSSTGTPNEMYTYAYELGYHNL